MTAFEGIVAIGVVAIPAWSAWSARRAAVAALVAARKVAEDTEANNVKVAEAAAKVAAIAKQGQDVAEASRKDAAAAVGHVAVVAKETSDKVEASSEKTLAKLDTLATAEQLDGGLTKMLDQIRSQIGEAYSKGLAEGQRNTVDAAVSRIEAALKAQDAVTASNERRGPVPDAAPAAARTPVDLPGATAATVEAAQHADELAKGKA